MYSRQRVAFFSFRKSLSFLLTLSILFGIVATLILGEPAFAYSSADVPRFTEGIIITENGAYFNIKINRNVLSDPMKNFTMISVCGIDNTSESSVINVINDTSIHGYGLGQYDELNGYNESKNSPYNLVMLFDDSKQPLGYYIFETPKTTPASNI
jgi:hypothetical protein